MKDITIKITDRENNQHVLEIPSDCGFNLMELCKSAELGVEGICGGIALCGTCQIYITSSNVLPIQSEEELAMLDNLLFVKNQSRLACQIKISEDLDQLSFTIAPNQ